MAVQNWVKLFILADIGVFGLWAGWRVFQDDELIGAAILLVSVVYVIWFLVMMWKWFSAREQG